MHQYTRSYIMVTRPKNSETKKKNASYGLKVNMVCIYFGNNKMEDIESHFT